MIVVATVLHPRGWRHLRPFFRLNGGIERQLRDAPGLVAAAGGDGDEPVAEEMTPATEATTTTAAPEETATTSCRRTTPRSSPA